MSLKQKIIDITQRVGPAARFGVVQVLKATVPGAAAVIDVVDRAFETAVDTAQGFELDEIASGEDLERVEQLLDVLETDLSNVVTQVAALEDMPEAVDRVLTIALTADETSRSAVVRIDTLTAGFRELEVQHQRLLENQRYTEEALNEVLGLVRQTAGISSYLEELRNAGLSAEQFGSLLGSYREGVARLAEGRTSEAIVALSTVVREQPALAAPAEALAAAQAANGQLQDAQATLVRAVSARPNDAELAELERRVTRIFGASAPAVANENLAIGGELNGWRLAKLLGEGGWGQVFRAERGDDVRALKILHPHLASAPGFEERFRREILALAQLPPHPALVRIEDFGYARESGSWFLLMEHVSSNAEAEAPTLEDHLSSGVEFDLIAAFEHLARGLAAAHDRGVFHRDIKPANILIGPEGPVLVDFGLAAAAGNPGLTQTGPSGHTPMFAAPEQLRGKPGDQFSDSFSFAATLFWCLNFDKPEQREPDDFHASRVPSDLGEILERALRGPRDGRPSLSDFAEALGGSSEDPDTPTISIPIETQKSPKSDFEGSHAGEIRKIGKLNFAWCPPGDFLMGSPISERGRIDDESQHLVILTKGFWLATTPLFDPVSRIPRTGLTWSAANARCEEPTPEVELPEGWCFRLPTEAEWEYACRAGTETAFSFGDTNNGEQAHCDGSVPYGEAPAGPKAEEIQPVAQHPANPWGLHDMHGNVWEWCLDWYGKDSYFDGDRDPKGPETGEMRVARGGSWRSTPRHCRSAIRGMAEPAGNPDIGMRIAICQG